MAAEGRNPTRFSAVRAKFECDVEAAKVVRVTNPVRYHEPAPFHADIRGKESPTKQQRHRRMPIRTVDIAGPTHYRLWPMKETDKEDKTPSETFRDVTANPNIPLAPIGTPEQPLVSKATQEEFEAALADFNTEVKGGLRQSLNSATPRASIEDLLKQEKPKE